MRYSTPILSAFVCSLSIAPLGRAQTSTTVDAPASKSPTVASDGIEDMTQTTMTSPSPVPAITTQSGSSNSQPTAQSTSTGMIAPSTTAAEVTSEAPASPALTKPSDEPAQETGSRVRTGFYFRVTTGMGFLSLRGSGPYGAASVSGLSSDGIFAIGGSIARGLVLAGTAQTSSVSDTFKGGPFVDESVTSKGKSLAASSKADASASTLGVLIDWYPRPAAGWHTGLALGLGAIAVANHADDSMLAGTGTAGSIFAGYDWFIARTWSMGLVLVGSTNSSSTLKHTSDQSDSGYRLKSYSIGIAGSILYF